MAFISLFWDVTILLLILYKVAMLWMNKKYNYWKEKGVKGPEPQYVFGNVKNMILLKRHMGYDFDQMYKKYRDLPFFGAFLMFKPVVVINDLELIKRVFIKDFASFADHTFELDPKHDPLSDNLFNVSGERWKSMRSKLTPTFTTNKMRYMFDSLKDCKKDLETYLEKVSSQNVNTKELLTFFGMNVIGSVAFGIECNTFEVQDSEFIKVGKKLFEINSFRAILQNTILFCMPSLGKALKFRISDKETTEFFCNLLKEAIEHRNKNNITRNDFLQILMQLQEHGYVDDPDGELSEVDDKTRFTIMQLAAQVFVFFVAGFDPTSNTSSFTLYEMAMNPGIQDKVREDINSVLKKHNGEISYEIIAEMTYLTQVIEETLRKHPPLPVLFRKCTKDYVIPNSDTVIEKDTAVMVPLYGIQHDPQYYPDPEKFDPERFSPENKASRPNFTYLPFGEGPRICIANRFGMMQMRIAILTILSKYKVSVCDKTPRSLNYSPKYVSISSDVPIWLKFTKV